MKAKIYIEGGGDSKELHVRLRKGFRELLEKLGLKRMPQLVACGGRDSAFDDFKTAHANAAPGDYIALLVDSEEPVADPERTWDHLLARDGWANRADADDKQVLLMTTCMETWIVTDRPALRSHYQHCLRETALPAVANMESRSRGSVQDALVHATRTCKNRYSKGKRSFEVLGRIIPDKIRGHLPSFASCERILKEKL